MFKYENDLIAQGCNFIAGIDEAGRGPLAGPVSVASVIMPLDEKLIIEGINDSKKLTEKKRELLYEKIKEVAIDYEIIFIYQDVIDDINILNATKLGMKKSIENLRIKPDHVLIDAVKNVDINIPNTPIIKGDSKSYSIAAASILAKVERDRFMKDIDLKYPEYNFKQHKGYGTKFHIEKIKEIGECEIHRQSFIKNFK